MSNERESEYRYIREVRDLMAEAEDAILRTLDDGARQGYAGEWRDKCCRKDHEMHAYAHIQGAHAARNYNEWLEHIQHAICRLVMASWRGEREWLETK